jgi:hypothetical protein
MTDLISDIFERSFRGLRQSFSDGALEYSSAISRSCLVVVTATAVPSLSFISAVTCFRSFKGI